MVLFGSYTAFYFVFHKQDQPPPSQTKFAALRRSLNELRHRISKRSRSKPPDWFSDKFQANSSSGQSSGGTATTIAVTRQHSTPSEELHTNRLCNRLSVDPSLPSHYRVNIIYKILILFFSPFVCNVYILAHRDKLSETER